MPWVRLLLASLLLLVSAGVLLVGLGGFMWWDDQRQHTDDWDGIGVLIGEFIMTIGAVTTAPAFTLWFATRAAARRAARTARDAGCDRRRERGARPSAREAAYQRPVYPPLISRGGRRGTG